MAQRSGLNCYGFHARLKGHSDFTHQDQLTSNGEHCSACDHAFCGVEGALSDPTWSESCLFVCTNLHLFTSLRWFFVDSDVIRVISHQVFSLLLAQVEVMWGHLLKNDKRVTRNTECAWCLAHMTNTRTFINSLIVVIVEVERRERDKMADRKTILHLRNYGDESVSVYEMCWEEYTGTIWDFYFERCKTGGCHWH